MLNSFFNYYNLIDTLLFIEKEIKKLFIKIINILKSFIRVLYSFLLYYKFIYKSQISTLLQLINLI